MMDSLIHDRIAFLMLVAVIRSPRGQFPEAGTTWPRAIYLPGRIAERFVEQICERDFDLDHGDLVIKIAATRAACLINMPL